DADLFADPCPANDIDAYARLADELEVPVAAGSTLGAAAFPDLVRRTRVGVLQPEIGRVGGITPLLKIIDLAETNHRAVMPVGSMEIAVHLACGRFGVAAVDFDRIGQQLFKNVPTLDDSLLRPQTNAGLGVTPV